MVMNIYNGMRGSCEIMLSANQDCVDGIQHILMQFQFMNIEIFPKVKS